MWSPNCFYNEKFSICKTDISSINTHLTPKIHTHPPLCMYGQAEPGNLPLPCCSEDFQPAWLRPHRAPCWEWDSCTSCCLHCCHFLCHLFVILSFSSDSWLPISLTKLISNTQVCESFPQHATCELFPNRFQSLIRSTPVFSTWPKCGLHRHGWL